MKFKLIVGNRRFQVDEISEVELIYYECKYRPCVSNNMTLIAMPKVSEEISCVLKLEDTTKYVPETDPIIGATFHMSDSILRGIRFQVPAKYFHSFKNPSKKRGYWKKVDCVDDLFICSSRNVLVLRYALLTGAE